MKFAYCAKIGTGTDFRTVSKFAYCVNNGMGTDFRAVMEFAYCVKAVSVPHCQWVLLTAYSHTHICFR